MMTREELFLYSFRCAEAIYRKPGQPVKSKAEILAEMPKDSSVIYIGKEALEDSRNPEFLKLMESRIKAAHKTLYQHAEMERFSDGTSSGGKPIPLTNVLRLG